jgi:hypothetical protein
MITRL